MTSRCICFFELMATMAISQRSHGWMLIDSPITAVFSPNLKNLPTNYLNEPKNLNKTELVKILQENM